MILKKAISEYKYFRIMNHKNSTPVNAMLRSKSDRFLWDHPCLSAYQNGDHLYLQSYYLDEFKQRVYKAFYRYYCPSGIMVNPSVLTWSK